MSRDAKIGIVVILIIVGLLVVIWGRGEKKNKEVLTPDNEEIALPPPPALTPSGVPGTTVTPAVPTTPSIPATPGAVTTTPGLPAIPTVGPIGTPEVVPPTATVPAISTLPVEPAVPTTSEYTVKSGDSLAGIARTELGSEARWQEIAKLNNLAAPYSLKIGQKLKLPAKTAATDTVAVPGADGAGLMTPGTPVVEAPPVVRHPAAPVVDTDPGLIEREGGPTVPIPGVVAPEAAAPVTDTAASAVAAGKYVVKSGDTLYSIARDVLKDPTKWSKLAELNSLTPPYSLKIGQELALPQ